MEGLLASLIATIPAENVIILVIFTSISISLALFEQKKSALSARQGFALIFTKGGASNNGIRGRRG